jgi:undecaprenyl-diphosphatase
MDQNLAEIFNSWTGQSPAFDLFLDFIQDSYLVKGLFAVCVLVALYTARSADAQVRLNNIYVTLILVFAGLFLARVMQVTLPFSPRPLHTDGMNLTLVTGISENALKHDSSFPSDHAVMFLTIASSVLMYARMAGLLLLGHAIFIICLPRLILGFHWSSDIIAGAAIGVTLAVLLQRRLVTWLGRSRLEEFSERHPSIFYALFFAILCETATMYRGSRHIISTVGDITELIL